MKKQTQWKFEFMFCHLFCLHCCFCQTKPNLMRNVNQYSYSVAYNCKYWALGGNKLYASELCLFALLHCIFELMGLLRSRALKLTKRHMFWNNIPRDSSGLGL